jgi:hypothetical protein
MTRRLITPEQASEIRRLHEEEGLSARELGERYGVHRSTVQSYFNYDGPLDLRLRWLSKLPAMKQAIRRDIKKHAGR